MKITPRRYVFFWPIVTHLILLLLPSFILADNKTENIYSEVEKSVYQVRVINKQTGKKTTIGSGFVIAKNNILATNYHVISAYVNDPENYSLNFFSISGKEGTLTLLDLDVVHDLAIVQANQAMGPPLKVASIPKKGATLYSLGNPLDLGFSIHAGTNNGMLQNSEDKSILFSGALNPGMSGGPTLNTQGRVVGINVATSGNEISFLIPVRYLSVILERAKKNNYKPLTNNQKIISQQLVNNSKNYIHSILKRNWEKTVIGNFKVPTGVTQSIRCWDSGRTPEKEDLFRNFFIRCSNENNIYLGTGLEVGSVDYEYLWLETDKVISPRFYRRYEKLNDSESTNNIDKDEVTEFVCKTRFVKIDQQDFKTTICRRDYVKYHGLSDVLITAALIGHKYQGFIFNLDFVGTDFPSAIRLFKKMLENFRWQT